MFTRKNYFSIFLLWIIVSINIYSQNTIGTIFNTIKSFEGYTLFTVKNSTYLINNCGQVVNKWTSDYTPGFSVYLLPDGRLLRAEFDNNSGPFIPGKGGRVSITDWNNNIEWEYSFSNSKTTQHHDIFPLPNGNILVLLVEEKSNAETILAGRNPANLIEDTLLNEKIIEVKPVGSNGIELVWEWNVWDHLIQDFDSSKNNYGNVLENPQLLDINYLGFSEGKENWLHVNSIQYNADLDQIVLSSRQLNEIYFIDHSTSTQESASNSGGGRGKGGDFLYRWGNPVSYRAGSLVDQKLFGQHFPNWIPNGFSDEGKILIFNNGFGRDTEYSSVDIINLPQTQPGDYIIPIGTKIGPDDFDWTYVDQSNPLDFFSKIMSSAQRLSNGNTMICEGTEGHFFEIDSNKNIIWEYIVPITSDGVQNQGDLPNPSRIFRAYKYSPDDVAFDGKDMMPGDPIELNFNIDACASLDVENRILTNFLVYPNPVKEKLHITSFDRIDKSELFNMQGVMVKRVLNKNTVDVKNILPGMYVLRVYVNDKIVNNKILIE